ncbi:hypothetical protein F3N42_10085 [Marinihelvus fidelis]|uniref:ATP synthase subunit I n=1 Tax=Marinihelvus fidelis TaxID=2613842 RepID=A0A5N0TA53_9GAMM|nr:ATP synthase subunit I [Marinihelvus fidelis]KAA9131651.1 hypothetical protein F3N42_10085 [Marinihelvus fidelis]
MSVQGADKSTGCPSAVRPVGSSNPGMVRRWLRMQSLASLAMAGALLLVGPVAAYSSMFGSLAVFLPALLFALVVARRFGSDPVTFLRAATMGEAGKLLMTVLVCVAVFAFVKPLAPGWFFAGMLVTMAAGWLGLIFNR